MAPSAASPVSSPSPAPAGGFRAVPKTGVIFVTTEANRLGFATDPADWCNLGQGMPETGPLPGGPPRVESIEVRVEDYEYAPVAGLWELREAIADLYNRLYRRGLGSKYSAENVAVSGGGRTALTRAAASLGQINLGHFLPDYTAYEELLDIFRLFSPIPILLEGERGYAFSVGDLRREILGRGLSALLLSNPCNPTGRHIRGEELNAWCHTATELDCALLVDEFYSRFVYGLGGDAPMESAARYVENVDRDPIVIFDGLTKNWRYPSWRVTWAVGPKSVVESMTSAGSFLDGGGSRPMQRAAIPLMDPDLVRAETAAIQRVFARKRETMITGLKKLGVTLDIEPEGTFYVWGNIADLPPGLHEGHGFFRAALDRKVITVPGEFFDVNPGKRRASRPSRFRNHVRFSFGPSEDTLSRALERLAEMVRE
ncbi:MAG: pyridoxal phosphate-dependent aminotransferase, partial [Myxococcales bacterium]